MKTGREHRVPLCGRALEILEAARKLGDGESPVVFVNERGRPLDGKRLGRLLRKHRIAAVPHVVQNKIEAAYRRTDLFDRRRRLMVDWEAYLAVET
ncbi:hypothetical protein [Candidatus Palauibacter sp.]|uniref:hypothetical protein n=1 Tax=Candidatus Palauibacter sp. TaxID=3101350 RepID=UPI003CC60E62